MVHLAPIDWVIIIAYFAISLYVGVIHTRIAGKSLKDFFISSNSLPWWALGISMVATTFSTDTPNLVTDIVRQNGVSGNWVWWAFLLTGMLTVFFYARLWRRAGLLTDMEFYELRYSGKPASFLRGFRSIYLGLFFNVMIMATVTLAATKIGLVLFGWSKVTVILVCCSITVLYSMLSGMWGVVVTDVIQFCLAMTGSIAAAYFALHRPEVGGLSGMMAKIDMSKLSMLPDFSNWSVMLPIFIVPLAIQWWSTWYPGAEPGGGGYIAQRMLASKDEKQSLSAVLLFNIAHYALRSWPWIIVALCSILVFPDLRTALTPEQISIMGGVENIRQDLGYSVMLRFLPAGLLGIMVVSLAAAYMSTISTHLNWGASYLVNDTYKRFMKRNASEKHYVMVSRWVTLGLMVIASLMSLLLENALQAFQILLTIGAGTGLVYILRWFWWRINAWTEITAMFSAFIVSIYIKFIHTKVLGFPQMPDHIALLVTIVITTIVWLIATFAVKPSDEEKKKLLSFYKFIKPAGPGWKMIAKEAPEVKPDMNIGNAFIAWMLGCVMVYSALFGTGFILYRRPIGVLFYVVTVLCALLIVRMRSGFGWSKEVK
ncbi:MAG: Na+:solute symporter [bacterium]|nr:Na+:solute symporter [bacterium]